MFSENKNIIFETEVDRFTNRFWKIFKTYLFFYLTIISILIYFNYENDSIITKICIILMFVFMISRYKSVIKWTKTKIERIINNEEDFEFQIIEKNVKKKIFIPKKDLLTILKWIGHRPKVLELTIFNNGKEEIKLYSASKTEIEQELEKISYRLKKASH